MRQHQHTITVATRGRGLYDFTRQVTTQLREAGLKTGLCALFVRHTSASLLIQENADPDVLGDLERFFARLVPEHDPIYRHTTEGPDDMPAHIRSALTQTQLAIPVVEGDLALGVWQGIYLFEHRTEPHWREIVLHLVGE